MAVTRAVVLLLLTPMWLVAPLFGPVRWVAGLALAAALALCLLANRRAGGGACFQRAALLPALGWIAAFTAPIVALALLAGLSLGTLHGRDHLALRFLLLLAWALAQQFILQTAILREARGVFSPRAARLVAASLFALVHLPNPFLTPLTFLAALGWCWIYDRHPNLLPIALSHATASLAVVLAFGPEVTGGMRVGYGYFVQHGVWL
jgi:membrane protease YdiL (CAAX protease family)